MCATHRFTCSDCSLDLIKSRSVMDDYMLVPKLWKQLFPKAHGFLCWSCLLDRVDTLLGRDLTPQDFTTCACFVNRHVHGLTAVEAHLAMKGLKLDSLGQKTLTSLRQYERQQEMIAACHQIDTSKLLTGWDEYTPTPTNTHTEYIMETILSTSGFTAVKSLNSWIDLLNAHRQLYVEDLNVSVQVFGGSRSMYLTDLTNAGQQGKTCTRIVIQDFIDYLNANRELIPTPAALVALVRSGAVLPEAMHTSEEIAQYTFTPFFDQKAMKAPKMDDKLRLPNVLKFLLKGDYKNVRCSYHSRGDGDFGETGDLDRAGVLALVQDITHSRSGWGCYWKNAEKQSFSLHCHSFLSYEITV